MPVSIGAPPQHGFDEPLGLLSDCHRRIEMFLGVLREIAAKARGAPLSQGQRAAVDTALVYFDAAAPRHNADEEQSLFPLLRASSLPAAREALDAIAGLEADHLAAAPAHREIELLYRQWLGAGSLAEEPTRRLLDLLHELTQMYHRHIAVEDDRIFPLAASLLGPAQLAALGKEMAARRGLDVNTHPHTQPKGKASMTIKNTIEVRTIPGPQRHPLIFRTFEALQPGEALEISNDHDPFPLKNQFNMLKRGQFTWDYLEQGPDLWRVRIGRVASPAAKV